MSNTVSRVMYQMIIYLGCPSPDSSSDSFPNRNATYPKARRATVWPPVWSCFEWGLHSTLCYQRAGGLLSRHSTLTGQSRRYNFCCTFLGVTSTGRYPAPCPMKPGLSSAFAAIICATQNQHTQADSQSAHDLIRNCTGNCLTVNSRLLSKNEMKSFFVCL